MQKLLVVLTMAAVVAVLVAGLTGAFGQSETPAVYASRLAGISSAGTTGIQVQNLDATQDATIVADFYKQDDGKHTSIDLPVTGAGSAANIYLPSQNLENGAYAAIISADRQIAAIARTEWGQSGGAALYSNVPPGDDVIVPLAVKQYAGQTSLVSIQNTDSSAQATVDVELYRGGQTEPVKQVQLSIQPGTSITLDLDKSDHFVDVMPPFLGSMRVKSGTQIAVQSFVDFYDSPMAVYAFEGVPVEAAADKLYVPLFRNGFYGTTGISVVNPGADDVDVTVKYTGSLGGCDGQTFEQTGMVAGGSSVVFYQGGDTEGTSPMPLPTNCGGAAVVEATGDIMAIVNDFVPGTTSAAYNAVSDAQGALKVALPLWRRNHMPTRAKLTTGIQAMNIGTAAANVDVEFKKSDGTPISGNFATTIPAGGAYTWYPPSIAELPDDTFGSASIESDQPIVVIVNDASGATNAQFMMDSAIYNGIKADSQ
jgi:hypothetical protein